MNSSSRRITASSGGLLALVLFFALAYILFPLYALLKESLSADGAVLSLDGYLHLFRSSAFEATANSLLISFLSVLGSAAVGTFFAYVFAFVDFPGKSILSKLILVPLALPPLVGVISFLFLVGESGMLSRLLSLLTGLSPTFFSVSGWTGIVCVHIYSFYVYFYLFVSSALSQLDGNVLDASASLGATRSRMIRRILLPMITPAFVGAALMTFMASMASFSAPFLFGGSTRFLTLEIYTSKLNGDNTSSAALSILLTIISVCILFMLRWWQSNKQILSRSKGTSAAARLHISNFGRRILIGLTVTGAVVFALPIVTIVILSCVKEGSWTYQIFPSSFTLANYARIFDDPALLDPFINSLRMSLLATSIVVLIGVLASYLGNRKAFPGSRWLEVLLTAPFGIPGTVIAVALILSFNRPTAFSFGSILVGTFWILPIAYAVRNLPLLYRSTTAGFESVDPSLYEAGEVLGSSNTRTFRKVILPIILPSIASGALLVFVNSVGEFVSSILLYSYSTKPVSVEILSQLRLFNIGGAAVYSTLLMILVLAAIAFSNRFFRSSFQA